MPSSTTEARRSQWESRVGPVLTAVAVAFLIAYAWPILDPAIPAAWHTAAQMIMDATWAVFAVDYVVRLVLSERRWRFVVTNPIELAVVLLPMLRPLRLLRLLTVLTVVHRTSGDLLRGRVAVYIAGGAIFLAVVGGLAILDAERYAPDSHITTFSDALWWALTTMTTVGYGDTYPVTPMGRLIAAGLMIGGIALLGSVTASLATWLTARLHDAEEENSAATRADIAALAAQVADLTRRVDDLHASMRHDTEAATPVDIPEAGHDAHAAGGRKGGSDVER